MEAAEAYTNWSVAADLRVVLVDAQTSGGLLIAVDADAAAQLETELRHRSVLAATIGYIVDGDRGRVEIA